MIETSEQKSVVDTNIIRPKASLRPGFAGMTLPSFRKLATAAAFANAPFVAVFLLLGKLWIALSLVAGLAVGLVVYGSLHLFVERGLNSFVEDLRGQARVTDAEKNSAMIRFGALLLSKYVLLGLIFFVVFRSGVLNLLVVLGGFLLTQITITCVAASQTRSK